jgi:YVTN family beta-propeller protein
LPNISGIEFVEPNLVYVGASTNSLNNGRIFVINAVTDRVSNVIEIGRPGGGAARIGTFVPPSSLYVGGSEGVVSEIDTKTNTIVASVNLNGKGTGDMIFVKPNRLYVSIGTPSGGDRVDVINTDTNTKIASIHPDISAGIMGFAEPNFLYLAGSGHITVVDTRSNTRVDGITYRSVTGGLEFVKPNFMYMSDSNNDFVDVIDTSTNTFVDSIRSGPAPLKIASSP